MELRADDAFWAARRVMAFTDDLIRAAVHTGQYSDPAAERHLAAVLIKRRDAIGRAYLTAINPIVDPRLDAGGPLDVRERRGGAGFAEAPDRLPRAWSRFDNATGATRPIGETRSATTSMAAARRTAGDAPAASSRSTSPPRARATRRGSSRCARSSAARTAGWKLVGLERLPDGEAAVAVPQPPSEDRR